MIRIDYFSYSVFDATLAFEGAVATRWRLVGGLIEGAAMPTTKLTRRTVAALPVPTAPTVYYDSEVRGFGLALRPTGARSWVVEYRPSGGGRGVAKRRLKIGDPETMTVEAARAAAKAILAHVALGEDPMGARAEARAGLTVGELADQWKRRHVQSKRKPKTAASYASLLDTHILPAWASRKVASLTKRDWTALHEKVAVKAVVPSRPGQKRAPATRTTGGETTANRVIAVARAMVRWGERVGLIPLGAGDGARAVEPFAERERSTLLSAENVAALGATLALAETTGLPSANGRPVRFDREAIAALRVLALTGCRLREVLNARWEHVDLPAATLWLPDAKAGARRVDLPPAAVAVIRGLPYRGVYVFAGATAGTKEERPRPNLTRLWEAVKRHAGLPEGTRQHDLRHHAGRVAAEAGRSLHEIGAMLGHSQQKTTARYARFSPQAMRRVADEVGGEVARAMGLGADVVDLTDRREARA